MPPPLRAGNTVLVIVLLVIGMVPGSMMKTRSNGVLQAIDSISVNTGSRIVPMWSGVFTDTDGREYFFFGDPVSRKRITFHDLDGALVRTVPLNAAIDSVGEKVGGISVIGRDSIVLNGVKGRRLVHLDGTGRVVRTVHLAPYATNGADRFDLGNSGLAGPYTHGAFFFVPDWTSNDREEIEGAVPPMHDRLRFRRYYQGHYAAAPHLARVTIDGTTPRIEWGLDSFYHHIQSRPWVCGELSHFGVAKDALLVYSIYSPTVQEVDPRTMQVLRSWDVGCVHGQGFIAPPLLDEAEANDPKRVNERLRTQGYIRSIVQDRVTGHYLVMMGHEVHEDAGEGDGYVHRQGTLLEYDGGLRLVSEREIDDHEHSLSVMFPTSKGVFILRSKPFKTQVKEPHVLDLFVHPAI